MALGNFKPTLWRKKILKELDNQHLLIANCTTEYNGEITGVGTKVKINSIISPEIKDYTVGGTITTEAVQDASLMLEITEAKYFAVEIDDVDSKQAIPGAMEEVIRKGTVGLNDTAERFVADMYLEAGNKVTEASVDTGNIYSTLMQARTLLFEENVGNSVDVVLEVTPDIYQKIVLADIVYSDGNQTAKKGKWSEVLNMTIFNSNNLVKNGRKSECVMRTKEAVGYAEQIMKTEKYRPQDSFSDAVKALHVYGKKVVKPKEIVHLELTTIDETTV